MTSDPSTTSLISEKFHKLVAKGVHVLLTHAEHKKLESDPLAAGVDFCDPNCMSLLLLAGNFRPTPSEIDSHDLRILGLRTASSGLKKMIRRFIMQTDQLKRRYGTLFTNTKLTEWNGAKGFNPDLYAKTWEGWGTMRYEDWWQEFTAMTVRKGLLSVKVSQQPDVKHYLHIEPLAQGWTEWFDRYCALIDGQKLTETQMKKKDHDAREHRTNNNSSITPINLTRGESMCLHAMRASPWKLNLDASDKGKAIVLSSSNYRRWHYGKHIVKSAWQDMHDFNLHLITLSEGQPPLRYDTKFPRTWTKHKETMTSLNPNQGLPHTDVSPQHALDPLSLDSDDDLSGIDLDQCERQAIEQNSYSSSLDGKVYPNPAFRAPISYANAEDVITDLWLKLEFISFTAYSDGLIPYEIVADICAWLTKPTTEQIKKNPEWRKLAGYGVVDEKKRREKNLGSLAITFKIHKHPIASRLIHQARNTVLTAAQRFVARILKSHRIYFEHKFHNITLSDTSDLLKRLERFNATHANTRRFTTDKGQVLVLATWDFEKMYPSLSPRMVVYYVDKMLYLYELETTDPEQKKERADTRELTIRFLIFLLENTFATTNNSNLPHNITSSRKGTSVFRSILGTPAGSVASPEVATIVPLMQEFEMVRDLKYLYGLQIYELSRLVDDGFCMFLSTQKKAKTHIELLKNRVETLDDRFIATDKTGRRYHKANAENCLTLGDSFRTTIIPLDISPNTSKLYPAFEFLDLFLHVKVSRANDRMRRVTIEHAPFSKEIAAQNFIHWKSAHQACDKISVAKAQHERLIINASTQDFFDTAWEKLKAAFLRRGYPAGALAEIEQAQSWTDRARILEGRQQRKEQAQQKEQDQPETAVDPLVAPDRPGMKRLWSQFKSQQLFDGREWAEDQNRGPVWKRPVLAKTVTPNLTQILRTPAHKDTGL